MLFPALPIPLSFLSPSLLRDGLATACVFAASNALLLLASTLRARRHYHPETTRKLLHLGLGGIALTYPFLFRSAWPVLVINFGFLCLLLGGLIHEPLQYRWRDVVSRVERKTVGEFYFPISIALLFLLTGSDPLLFCIPVLILTIADAAAALVGCHYGRHTYRTAAGHKSLEGSAAFFLAAFLLTQLPLLLFTPLAPAAVIAIASTLALAMTIVEALSWRGLDNLLLPLASFALLNLLLRAAA